MNGGFLKSISSVSLLVTMLILLPARSIAAECAGRSVADCADNLAEKIDGLIKDNNDLHAQIQALQASVDKRFSNSPRILIGEVNIDSSTSSASVSFPADVFTSPPKVEIATSEFFGGLISGNFYRVDFHVDDKSITKSGFQIVRGDVSANARFVWIAIQQ